MFRKTVSGIVLTLLLLGILTLAFDVQPVKSEPRTWTVDDDGPADFNTIQEAINAADPGDIIFVHSGTYYENVFIDKPVSLIGENKSTTVIDGEGAQAVLSIGSNVTVSGFTTQNGGDGISVWAHGNNVSGNIVTQNGYGIYLGYADENTVSRNIVTQNGYGIKFDGASGNILRYNTMTDNIFNFKVFGFELSHFIHDIDTSNTVNGKPIYYLINERNLVVDTLSHPNLGYLAIVNSSSVIVRNLNLTKNGQGVLFAFSTNSTVVNVTASSCEWGIHLRGMGGTMIINNTLTNNWCGILDQGGGNTVQHNNITSNRDGIRLHYADGVTLSENTITNNDFGIIVGDSNNNFVNDNMITDNVHGVELVDAHGNMIINNTLTNNDRAMGFAFSNKGNIIYHNNFINNTEQVYIDYRSGSSLSTWDNGYPSGGNYWSDHNPPDEDLNKIGDLPYVIDENNLDRYPLIYPYGFVPKPDVNEDGIVDILDLYVVARAFGTKPGDDRWDPIADVEMDEIIGIRDIYVIAKNYGKT